MDASKKIFEVAEPLLFDFELFIGEWRQKKRKADDFLKLPALIIYATRISILSKVPTVEALAPHLSSAAP